MGDLSLLMESVRRFARSKDDACPGEAVPSPLKVTVGERTLTRLTASASIEPLHIPRERTCASKNAKSPAKESTMSEICVGILQSSMAWLSFRRQMMYHCS